MSVTTSRTTLVSLVLAGTLMGAMAPAASAAGPGDAFSPGATRLSGPDRIATAVAASRATFPDSNAESSNIVVVASAANYADAIGGGTLAAVTDAPLLLVEPGALRQDVAAEIVRVTGGAGGAFVLGGSAAISEDVVEAISDLGPFATRISGPDRYSTAAQVARAVYVYGGSDATAPIYLASGTNFPDGLAVAPLAADQGGVVLLTQGVTMAAPTQSYLQDNDADRTRTVAVGGAAATAEPRAQAVVGSDRYDTAAKVAARFAPGVASVGLSTGENWPDALVASATMGQAGGGPLLLTNGADASAAASATDAVLAGQDQADAGLVFGGTKAVSADVYDAFASRF